jgi:hypothetical protein
VIDTALFTRIARTSLLPPLPSLRTSRTLGGSPPDFLLVREAGALNGATVAAGLDDLRAPALTTGRRLL